MKRRAVAVVIVAGTTALAVASVIGGGGLRATPGIAVIHHVPPTPGSGTIALQNTTAASIAVSSFAYACDSAMGLAPASGGAPFTIGVGSSKTIAISCPGSLAPGMHRCTFTAVGAGDLAIASFEGVCESGTLGKLEANPTSLAFGSVTVGQSSMAQTVNISNTGATDVTTLQLQVDDDSFLIGAPCNPDATGCDAGGVGPMAGSGATIAVKCRPTSPGAHTGQLHAIGQNNGLFLATNVGLTCTGVTGQSPQIQVTPTTLPITPDVEVMGGTGSGTVSIANVGGGSLHVSDIQLADAGVPGAAMDWSPSVSGTCTTTSCDLAMNQTLDVRFVFDPSAIGPRPATLIVSYDDGAPRTTTVALTGTGRGATLELVGPSTIDFGVVALNMTATQAFTLGNHGNRDLLDATATMASAPFTLPANPILVKASPPNTSVPVMCRSSTPGVFQSTVHVSAPDVPGTGFNVTFKCDVRDTLLVANPSSKQLGEVRTGTTVADLVFNLTSLGTPIQITSVALAMPNPALTIVAPAMPVTTPATIRVSVATAADGPLDASIVVTPVTGLPIQIPLSGALVTASYGVPSVVSLGAFCVGQATTASNILLQSTGTATMTLDEPALMENPSPYALAFSSPAQYPALLPPMGAAMVQVTPRRQMIAGTVTDSLTWSTDVVASMTQTTMLSTEFIADGGAIAPSALAFGKAPIHVQSPNGMQVTLQNCDVSALDMLSPEVTGPFALEGTFPEQLAPSERATFSVVFQPTAVGPAMGELRVKGRQLVKPLVVTLTGEGITDGSPGDDTGNGNGNNDTSFYACASCATNHDPTGVLAIALATMCALVPRRRRR